MRICVASLEALPLGMIQLKKVLSVFICVHLCPKAFLLTLATLLAFPALAEVTITDAWVRGTVPAQTSTGAFMKMKSTEDVKVVAAKSPAAKVVEIHEMSMKGGTMEMRAVAALALPAGKTVELRSGGYHVMMMDLAKPLAAGETVPITFTVEGAGGKRTTVEVRAKVVPLGAQPDGAR